MSSFDSKLYRDKLYGAQQNWDNKNRSRHSYVIRRAALWRSGIPRPKTNTSPPDGGNPP